MSPIAGHLVKEVEKSYERRGRLLHCRGSLSSPSSPARAEAGVEADAVWQYCRNHRLVSALGRALGIVRACFPNGRNMRLRIAVDPEVGDDWIAIDLWIPGTVEEFMRAYNEYTRRIVESLLPDQWLRIRLAYNVV